MLKPGRVWQEETFKIEISRGCQGSFFVFSIFLAKRKPCLTNFSDKLKARKANKEYLLCQILKNFTEGNSRNLIRIFLSFHLNGNYVIRIGTRQDRYVSMREFSNHAVLSMSDSTMAVSSKYTQDLSVHIVFITFSCKWFLCFYFWATIWSYIVDLFAALLELASASARTLLKLASSVRALLKPYGDTLMSEIKWLSLRRGKN